MAARPTNGTDRAPGNARGRRSRERIIEAAIHLFWQRGLHGVSLEDIGREADLTPTALYRHFETKAHLYVALLEIHLGLHEELLRKCYASDSADPEDRLRLFVTGLADLHLEHPELSALAHRERETLPGDVRRTLNRRWHLVYSEAITLICEARPDLIEEEARVINHAVAGLLNSTVWYRSAIDPLALRTMLINMALKLARETKSPAHSTPRNESAARASGRS